MVYVCVICMCPYALEPLSAEHREILECLVSTSVNLVEFQNVKDLLVCSCCVSLIKALVKLKKTAIAGVTHVLRFWSKEKKTVELDEVLVKEEPHDKDTNLVESDFAMELVPEFVNIQDDIKFEQDMLESETTQNWENIEETIPKSTIQPSNINTGVVIVQNNKNNNDNNIRIMEVPSLHQTEKSAIFTHSKTSNCISEPKIPTKSTKIVTETPKQIRVVQRNILKKPQDTPLFKDPNLPQFLPYYNKLNKNNTIPAVQKLLLKLKPTNEVTQPVTVKKVSVRNIKLSTNKVLREVKIGDITNFVAKIRSEKIAQTGIAKRAEERNVNPSSNPEQQLEEVVIEPRWCTEVFPYRKMIMARVKERGRPEFVDAPFKCGSCILVFHSQEETDEHAKKHVIGPDKLPCKVCALPISPRDEATHEKMHATRHQCARCSFSTEQLSVIEAHDCSAEP